MGKRKNGFVEGLEMSEINFKATQSPTEVQKDQLNVGEKSCKNRAKIINKSSCFSQNKAEMRK